MPICFAYGSNLDLSGLRHRCPSAQVISPGRLKDYRLGFTRHSTGWNCGVADVLPSVGEDVWGLVFEINESDLSALDKYEGYPTAYDRFAAGIESEDRVFQEVWVYTVRKKREFIAPNRDYVDIIRRAACELGFPKSYRDMLDRIEVRS